jgi:hypothetical protein
MYDFGANRKLAHQEEQITAYFLYLRKIIPTYHPKHSMWWWLKYFQNKIGPQEIAKPIFSTFF